MATRVIDRWRDSANSHGDGWVTGLGVSRYGCDYGCGRGYSCSDVSCTDGGGRTQVASQHAGQTEIDGVVGVATALFAPATRGAF